MSKYNRRFSKSEKLEAIELLKKLGPAETSRRVGTSPTSLYKWLDQYEKYGEFGLKSKAKENKDKELLRLERENTALKQLLADKELRIRIQDELLKKANKRGG